MDHRSSDAIGGWVDARTYSATRSAPPAPVVHCALLWQRPAGNIRVNINWWKWQTSPQGWYICHQTGWYLNRFAAVTMALEIKFADDAPCGSGYYFAQSMHGVWNSGWYGGDLTVPYSHWFPDFSSSASEIPPTVPDAHSARAPLAGPDGQPVLDQHGDPVLVDTVPPDDMIGAPAKHSTVTGPGDSVNEVAVITR